MFNPIDAQMKFMDDKKPTAEARFDSITDICLRV